MKKGLTNNQLKIIALVSMTIDHIGTAMFPDVQILRIIGRLAFPIFAYMIAEGCKYTRNRKRYVTVIAVEALICQLVFFAVEKSLYMNIFVTFTLSIFLIFLADKALKSKKASYYVTVAVCLLLLYCACEILPKKLAFNDFDIDYGFFGVITPAVIYFAREEKQTKISVVALMCILLGLRYGDIQYYSLLSVLPLLFYNGERGKLKLKYFFYAYYPLHLAVIYLVSLIILK